MILVGGSSPSEPAGEVLYGDGAIIRRNIGRT